MRIHLQTVAKSISESCGKWVGIHLESTFKGLFRCAGFTNNFGHFSEGGFQVDFRWISEKQTLTGHTVFHFDYDMSFGK